MLLALAVAYLGLMVAATSATTPAPFGTSNVPWSLLAWSEGVERTEGAVAVDIDLFDMADRIDALRAAGAKKIICYYSAGTSEGWRDDVEGSEAKWEALAVRKMEHWDEMWLDVQRWEEVAKLMAPRLARARHAGCDVVEPDNTDCFDNDECWKHIEPPVTRAEARELQAQYNSWTAREAHRLGMLVCLKNSNELIGELVDQYDCAVVEDCIRWESCGDFAPFVAQNKPVFAIEYARLSAAQCTRAREKQHIQLKYCASSNHEECNDGAVISNCFSVDPPTPPPPAAESALPTVAPVQPPPAAASSSGGAVAAASATSTPRPAAGAGGDGAATGANGSGNNEGSSLGTGHRAVACATAAAAGVLMAFW